MTLVRDEQLMLCRTDPLSDRGSIWVKISKIFRLSSRIQILVGFSYVLLLIRAF